MRAKLETLSALRNPRIVALSCGLLFVTALPAQSADERTPVVAPDRSARLSFTIPGLQAQPQAPAPEGVPVQERDAESPRVRGNAPTALAADRLVNDNIGYSGTLGFTQSSTAIAASGNLVVVGFNDAGSAVGGTAKFTGFSRSTDGGATFTDGGTLPTNINGDLGQPVLARNETTGRVYMTTAGLFSQALVHLFRSDDNGATWMAPTNAAPGSGAMDKPWMVVDNFPGSGNGNVYASARDFGFADGIDFYRSTDHGDTFGPNGGTFIVTGGHGVFIAIGPDHAVYVFWYAQTTGQLVVRKSTDLGITFGAPVTVVSGLVGGTNGDMALTGIRQGVVLAAGFRSNSFPHAAVNPVSGHLYVTFNDNPAGVDKADVFLVTSTDGGATWSARVRVNDDATTTDQWMPTIAVTPDGSKLGIFFYSRQEDAVNNNLLRYYGRVGAISGGTVTLSPSFAISDVASLPEFGRDAVVGGNYMGDSNQAAATPGAFHVVWADNRDDLAGGAPRKDPNVYYEKILTSRFGVTAAREKLGPVDGAAAPMGQAASGFRLFPSTPNPFAGSTRIEFDLPATTESAELAIYDVQGRKVRTLIEGVRTPGRHTVDWDGTDDSGARVVNGVYFSRLRAGTFEETQRVVPLR